FRAGEWMRFRVVWSRDKGVLGGYSVKVYINGEEVIRVAEDIRSVSKFMKYVSIGASGHWGWYPGEDRNMYMNACGVFDELYIWDYPKLD
ncbi:MAG: hypothetical protein ABDH28_05565, partial [Brevinematia bacterium]